MPEEIVRTPQPVEPKTTNWLKIILAAVLGLGLLAAAAYAGYRYGVTSKGKSQTSKVETTPTVTQPTATEPSTTPVPEPTTPTPTTPTDDMVDDTEGWKIYSNDSDNYSLKYPSDWVFFPPAEEGVGGVAQFYNYDRSKRPARGGIEGPLSDLKIEVVVSENPKMLSSDQWVVQEYQEIPGASRLETTNIVVANKPATKIKSARDTDMWLTVIVTNDAKAYRFVVSPADSTEISRFDQILSTFRFLD